MKKLASIIMAGIMCLSMASCKNSDVSDKGYITENGKMVVGMTIYEPMNYEDENGELTGFDTEFAKLVCEKLGVEAEFVEIDWDNKFPELSSRSIDCIWNGMTITEEVKLNADVSKAYVKNAQVVVMNKDKVADYQTVESLADIKFAAEAGSAGEAAIKEAGLDDNYIENKAQTDALLAVVGGQADACVIDITMAKSMTAEGTSYEDLAYSIELTTEEYGIGFRKDSNVTAEVDKVIDELVADGTMQELAEKYGLNLAF